ncbi:unnamed protein product (mitochondrion) [Plasmodiophora brassicae]|uniref:Uncharacterized protein n=1 Tax=Plasmodiophora brassicae TaxID=37360 RepID=A0A0G4IPR3_PLABS|nr:hypothetical protein PBRA_005765 [Plasmodiophora brassicae]SPR01136.1 unnamed protein product [Plasmodiophora brassicae]
MARLAIVVIVSLLALAEGGKGFCSPLSLIQNLLHGHHVPKTYPVPTPVPSFVFSPYKDVTLWFNWTSNVIGTNVTGTYMPMLDALKATGVDTVTWAFATGTCASETWAAIKASDMINANIAAWARAGVKYIISTGGAAGAFRCANATDFLAFINRYKTPSLIGIDLDIEGTATQGDIDHMVQVVKAAQRTYPTMRFSFTVPTLGGTVVSGGTLGTIGNMLMGSLEKFALTKFFVNLMTMNYGDAAPGNCVLGIDGRCEMGLSAIQAARNLHDTNGIPYSQIEITPMIGGNDSPNQMFTLEDAKNLATFAKLNGLGGIHFWSFDRDNDCPPGPASPLCNTYGNAGTLGFTKAFTAAFA